MTAITNLLPMVRGSIFSSSDYLSSTIMSKQEDFVFFWKINEEQYVNRNSITDNQLKCYKVDGGLNGLNPVSK